MFESSDDRFDKQDNDLACRAREHRCGMSIKFHSEYYVCLVLAFQLFRKFPLEIVVSIVPIVFQLSPSFMLSYDAINHR